MINPKYLVGPEKIPSRDCGEPATRNRAASRSWVAGMVLMLGEWKDTMSDEEEYSELFDIDVEAFRAEYSRIVETMIRERAWYRLNGSYKGELSITQSNCQFEQIKGRKTLVLGRSSFYDRFMSDLLIKDGIESFQSDYLLWIEPSDPYRSLLFYIDTAERIHFNIEGLGVDDIRQAVVFNRAAEDRSDLQNAYMTIWEMNRVLYSSSLEKTLWHVNGEYSRKEIDDIMGLLNERFIVDKDAGHGNRFKLIRRQ